MNKRNMNPSISDDQIIYTSMPGANWNEWRTTKAVAEGYKVSGWVYRAISIIARSICQAPIVVYDRDNQALWEHPLTQLLAHPNKSMSYNSMLQLLVSWLNLSGSAFLYRNIVRGNTVELLPVSPDRLAPVPSNDPVELLRGYAEINNGVAQTSLSQTYTTDNIVRIQFVNPANPIEGIGPLQVAAASVDTDTEQRDWNKAAMQNRGVMDGVFIFDKEIPDERTFNLIMDKIKARFSGSKRAREPAVIGSGAKYQQLSLTPVEMDFLNSRKFNREEIFIIFGVPPQLAGVADTMTYNNYSESLRILWESTLLPILDIIVDSLNFSMGNELRPGEYIGYDTSNIRALKEGEKEKADTAAVYYRMGVPVEQINQKFDLGLEPYDGWELSNPAGLTKSEMGLQGTDTQVRYDLIPMEQRSLDDEIKTRDDLAEGSVSDFFNGMLQSQQKAAFGMIDKGVTDHESYALMIQQYTQEMLPLAENLFAKTAKKFVGTVAKRSGPVDLERRAAADLTVENYIKQESAMLKDLSFIAETTIGKITSALTDMLAEGKTAEQLKQAILDSGVFSSARALMLARTLSGTAMSIGQLAGGVAAGATQKVWHTSHFEVREAHQKREGETVGINDYFSRQLPGGMPPRFPLDPNIDPGDRINCRCAMSFK